jgi:uncharacterized protein
MNRLKICAVKKSFIVICIFLSTLAEAQIDSLKILDPIQVLSRTSADSIVLRWAPIETNYWMAANKHGYTIERYTLIRDGKSLSTPERKLLTPAPLKPYPESQWEVIVNNNKYVAIAAQALLGESFELDIQRSGAANIVNKATENDQRFYIALYCADLSVTAAKALALYWADEDVKKNEKYFYRITIAGPKSGVLSGGIYVSADEAYALPAPLKFSAEVKNNTVSLRWNQSYHKGVYTSYVVERSEDGVKFNAISEDAISTLTPASLEETEYQYAIDSLKDISKEFYYRVRGLTPFGEFGPPSEVKTVRAKKIISDLPYITSAISTDNKTVTLTWDFSPEHNSSIDGFYIERSVSPSSTFTKSHDGLLPKDARLFLDTSPRQTNYYRISVQTTDKQLIRSMIYYSQLVDSIPPASPSGVQGIIDEFGNVTLSWKPNVEEDIHGYRVYRAYYTSEEFAQLTEGPVSEAKFNDRVNVQSLNEKIHYRVMAIDNNQNHSRLSEVYSLTLPDKVPPVTPMFLPIKSAEDGVNLSWMPSSSTDVSQYELYRKSDNNQWIRITVIPSNSDTLYVYKDMGLANGELRYYTIVAVDDSGLESPPSPAVAGQKLRRRVWPAVALQAPVIDRENKRMTLRWGYDQIDVKLFQVYKSINDQPLILYRSVSRKDFTDRLYDGKYHYKVVAVFADGSKSEMGEGLSFEF